MTEEEACLYLTRVRDAKRYAKRVTVKRDALLRFREEAAARIERLPDVRFREILKSRYLEGDTWEWIAGGLCYDVRHVQRLHKRALAAMAQE